MNKKAGKPVIKKNQRMLNLFHALSDVCIVIFSYLAAIYLRFAVMGGEDSVNMLRAPFVAAIALYSAALVFAFYMLHMYTTHRVRRWRGEYMLVLMLNGVGILALMTLFYMVRVIDVSRMLLFLFWLMSSTLIIAKRMAVRAILRHYRRRGYNIKHVIIVGSGHLAQQCVEDIGKKPYLGLVVRGYVSEQDAPQLGVRLGSYQELNAILEEHKPDELIVALEPQEMAHMPDVLAAADREGVRLSLIPFYNDYIPQHPTIDSIGRTRLIDMRSTPLDNLIWATCKRTMDIVGSLLLILVTSPVMLAVAIGVKLSSPGPVIFRQERVGKDKRPFYMYKFRSMRVTGTEATGWSSNEDPRKTRFGSFIRKFSLDELPQFFNVLKGDMSLVGPRPEVPFHVQHFKKEIPRYLVRQQIRPGITGWAQVNGLRGDTSIEDRVEYDLWYIENWSLDLDVKILLRTAFGGMVNAEIIATGKDNQENKPAEETIEKGNKTA